MNLAVLTCHQAHNCGAMLQAWALKTVLERMRHHVTFPFVRGISFSPGQFYIQDIPKGKRGLQWWRSLLGRLYLDVRHRGQWTRSDYEYATFRRKYFTERKCAPKDFDKLFDIVIIGSDQVWNDRIAGMLPSYFLCETIPSSLKRISYAASVGDKPPSRKMHARIVEALRQFSAVSVREPLLQNVLEQHLEQEVAVTVDPTLLLEAKDYDCLPPQESIAPKEPYLYLYALEANEFEVATARALAKVLDVKLVITPVYVDIKHRGQDDIEFVLSPSRMLDYIRNAHYVLASSFHGTVFSVLYKKQFLALRNQVDSHESRPAALLNLLDLGERLVNPSVSVDEMKNRLVKEWDSDSVEKQLSELRSSSISWLRNAIEDLP